MKYIRKEQELKKKALEDELDGYKKLYDAQAKALDKQKEADDYAKTAAKKRADIAEIETRLNELSADTSAASQREQAELRAELAEKQEDLEEYEKEQSIERQKEKLDEEYALLEEQNNAKIEKIDEFLDNEGRGARSGHGGYHDPQRNRLPGADGVEREIRRRHQQNRDRRVEGRHRCAQNLRHAGKRHQNLRKPW